jgi:ribosome-binding ATPase
LFFAYNSVILYGHCLAKLPGTKETGVYISIIGSPGCGKTTLFRAFTGMGEGASSSNIAVIDVPDERLGILSKIFKPKKTVYGQIEVCNLPSIQEGDAKKEAIPAKQMQQMRVSDAFLLILRNFGNGVTVDPVAEFHTILSEFMIADMVQIESRLERISKQANKKQNVALEQEAASLEQCLAHLNEGRPLSSLPLFQTDGKSLRSFQFLSQKPLMVVLNSSEEATQAESAMDKVRASLPEATPAMNACVSLEAELAMMEAGDRAAFMQEYGVAEEIRPRLVRLAFETLGLISFITVGEDECRAWPVRRGVSAQEAAGTIHTDLSDRFIRAETVGYEDFIRHGDFAGCKKAGVWRLEGKQYIVSDGDILSIRAGN